MAAAGSMAASEEPPLPLSRGASLQPAAAQAGSQQASPARSALAREEASPEEALEVTSLLAGALPAQVSSLSVQCSQAGMCSSPSIRLPTFCCKQVLELVRSAGHRCCVTSV